MFIGCSHYPDCDFVVHEQQDDEQSIDCPECHKGHLVARRGRQGKIFMAAITFPHCKFSLPAKPYVMPCPQCHFPLALLKVKMPNTKCGNVQIKAVDIFLRTKMNVQQIAACLMQDEVVAYPTEAVFGLGCNPLSESAVRKLLDLKQRPIEKVLFWSHRACILQPFIDFPIYQTNDLRAYRNNMSIRSPGWCRQRQRFHIS